MQIWLAQCSPDGGSDTDPAAKARRCTPIRVDGVSERQGWDDDPDEVLPEQTSDDTDRGWGEHPDDGDGLGDDERLIREKPPHW
jgi:hypothetical protein